MVTLAITSALLWGVGNFGMGLSARLSSARGAVVIGFATGTALSAGFLLIQRPEVSWAAVGCGAGAGVAQGVGWMLFARSLTNGRMAVVAPIAAMSTVLLLLLYAAIGSGVPSARQLLGVLLCLAAVFLLSRGATDAPDESPTGPAGPLLALGAGALFAAQAGFLSEAPSHATSAVMVAAGLGVLAAMSLAAMVRRISLPTGRGLLMGSAGGAALFVGDAAFIYALDHGNVAVATSIGQLHPIATAGLAALLLRERPTLAQAAGLVLAIAALISITG